MIFERMNAVENSVVKFLFPQIIPDMLYGVELRRIWRKPEQTDIATRIPPHCFLND